MVDKGKSGFIAVGFLGAVAQASGSGRRISRIFAAITVFVDPGARRLDSKRT